MIQRFYSAREREDKGDPEERAQLLDAIMDDYCRVHDLRASPFLETYWRESACIAQLRSIAAIYAAKQKGRMKCAKHRRMRPRPPA